MCFPLWPRDGRKGPQKERGGEASIARCIAFHGSSLVQGLTQLINLTGAELTCVTRMGTSGMYIRRRLSFIERVKESDCCLFL